MLLFSRAWPIQAPGTRNPITHSEWRAHKIYLSRRLWVWLLHIKAGCVCLRAVTQAESAQRDVALPLTCCPDTSLPPW